MTNEQIIEQIEKLLIQLKESLNLPSKILPSQKTKYGQPISRARGFSGLTGKIYELMEEGFFDKPVTISDLQKKLKDRGTKKETTTIMPSLKLLLDKKILDRNKPDKGFYKYFKR